MTIETLTLAWEIVENEAGKKFLLEKTFGDLPAANGEVMIGPFNHDGAARAMLYQRQEAFADLFKRDRQRIEASKAEVARMLERQARERQQDGESFRDYQARVKREATEAAKADGNDEENA